MTLTSRTPLDTNGASTSLFIGDVTNWSTTLPFGKDAVGLGLTTAEHEGSIAIGGSGDNRTKGLHHVLVGADQDIIPPRGPNLVPAGLNNGDTATVPTTIGETYIVEATLASPGGLTGLEIDGTEILDGHGNSLNMMAPPQEFVATKTQTTVTITGGSSSSMAAMFSGVPIVYAKAAGTGPPLQHRVANLYFGTKTTQPTVQGIGLPLGGQSLAIGYAAQPRAKTTSP